MTAHSSPSAAPLHVLVVDDEALIRWAIAEALAVEGHRVDEAATGDAAMRAVASATEPFDVVLLDYRLPDSADLQLLASIRRMHPDAAVLLMTAYGSPEITGNALSLGAYDVLSKPFDMHTVGSVVRAAYRATH